VRLKRAADLLEETDESIQEIAYSCGFREPNYFSRVFRKKYGRSPREFRLR
jgi:AraC-like DNA-binding protein